MRTCYLMVRCFACVGSCCATVVAVVLERCGTWVYDVGFCKRKRVEIVIYIKLYIIHVSYLLRHVHKVL